jgi:Tol biopolymer transport system component
MDPAGVWKFLHIGSNGRRRRGVAGRSFALLSVATVVSLSALVPAHAAFPGENGLIAFTRNGRIWVTDTDGNDTRLTRGADPTWSPDGTRIAFRRVNPGTNNMQIWTMRADGSERTRMTSGPNYNFDVAPSWSPDGSKLIFVLDGDIAAIDAALSLAPFAEPQVITDTPRRYETHPVWSPDGTKIAFEKWTCGRVACGIRIGTVAPDGRSYRMLTPLVNDRHDLNPDWSPDSTMLVFQSDREDTPYYYDVYTISASGTDVTQLTFGATLNEAPAWSPDGRRIVYMHSTTRAYNLRIVRSIGGSSVYITHSSMYQGVPDWQPLTSPIPGVGSP